MIRRRLLRLYTALHARYGPQDWWPARGRFEVAVGAVLTQHTAWTGVERAIDNLRAARRLAPRRLARLALPRLGRLIRPAGTWRLKARRLRALAVFFLARTGGARLDRLRGASLETLRAQLLEVPGIGPETADAILLYALDRPVFVADAYTRRVLSRHRIVPPRHRLRGAQARHRGAAAQGSGALQRAPRAPGGRRQVSLPRASQMRGLSAALRSQGAATSRMSRARRWAASGTASVRARAPIASRAAAIGQEARERVYEALCREIALWKDHGASRGLYEPGVGRLLVTARPRQRDEEGGRPRLQHSMTVPAPLRPTSKVAAA